MRMGTILATAAILAILTGAAIAAEQPKPDKPISPQTLEKVEAALPTKPYAQPAKPRKMLIFTMTKGFRHSSIPLAAKTLEMMGKKTGAYETVTTDDIEALRPANLAKFDAFCSDQNTGSWTDDKEIKQGLLDFVKNGKGWVGVHAATDVGGWKFPEYHEMIGGVFAGHPFRRISVKIDDPKSPINQMFEGKGFEISDEIYTFKGAYSREKLRVLLSIDWDNAGITKGMNREDNDYALSWIREYGKGRVFYCGFGHDDQIWYNPAILAHYLAGIQYAMGDLKADATPSSQVTITAAPGPKLQQPAEKPKAKK